MLRRPKPWTVAAASTIFAAAAGAALMVETVTVQPASIDLRSKKGTMWPVVATAKKGDVLTVAEKSGSFYKLQAGGKEGWISSTELTPANLKADGTTGVTGTAMASGIDAGGVGKGLGNEAEIYAKANGFDPKPVDHMIEIRKRVTGERWLKFAQAGNVLPK